MFSCPRCHRVLTRMKTESGLLWSCDSCEGRAVNLSVLRLRVEKRFMNRMWQDVRQAAEAGKVSSCRCPSCNHAMHPVDVDGLQGIMEIDACDTCQFLWLDKGEGFAMPLLPAEEEEKELDPRVKEILARREVEAIRERYAAELDSEPPESWPEFAASVMGLPVEENHMALRKAPWATRITAVLIVSVSVAAFATGLEEAIEEYGLIPADAFRDSGITILTSILIHGGLWHLVANVYFLILVGDNVEDFVGRVQFCFIFLLGAMMGEGFHILPNPGDTTPLIGASGGVSGLMVYYALQFPRIRLCFFGRFGWFRMTAAGALVIWIGMQLLGVWQQVTGMSNVSGLAHLGGACVGLFFWFAGRFLRGADLPR